MASRTFWGHFPCLSSPGWRLWSAPSLWPGNAQSLTEVEAHRGAAGPTGCALLQDWRQSSDIFTPLIFSQTRVCTLTRPWISFRLPLKEDEQDEALAVSEEPNENVCHKNEEGKKDFSFVIVSEISLKKKTKHWILKFCFLEMGKKWVN